MRTSLALFLGLSLLLWASVGLAGWQEDYRKALSRQNFTEALRIAQSQAELGDAEAQNCLGLLYLNGQGVNMAEVEGLSLLMVAAKNGSVAARGNSEFMKMRMKQEHVDKASEVASNHRWRRNR